ncbi:MAG: SDR family NAD(P)-dependent oxidoreductase, partial [Paludibacteraceae bacterium]|nr:SDR family NAD(P)-dependent oxidoreductase [Paludibacteraceae bacterium]
MKYALVTGASSGIGLQYAHRLAEHYKYDLVLVSNQEKEIKETADEMAEKYGVKAISIYKDLSTESAPQELFDYCKENGIEIEVLINNAGVFFFNDLANT